MLKSVQKPSGAMVSFEYDPLGRRTAKITGNKITRYLWDANVLLQEWSYDPSDRPKLLVGELGELFYDTSEPVDNATTWVYEEENYVPIAKLVNGERFSIIFDYIGRPIQVFNDTGEVVWETEYDLYGRLKNLKGDRSFQPFRQLGQYEDVELDGLYYNRHRFYDSQIGLYISQDPIGLNGGTALYGYVHDPNTWVDTMGLSGIFSPSIFNAPSGNVHTVYQQNIDWNLPSTGKGGITETNLDRAMRGDAPFVVKDGKYSLINLHHSKQNANGSLFELSAATHQKYYGSNALHPHLPNAHPDNPVNRAVFDGDREAYWMQRANEAKAKMSCG